MNKLTLKLQIKLISFLSSYVAYLKMDEIINCINLINIVKLLIKLSKQHLIFLNETLEINIIHHLYRFPFKFLKISLSFNDNFNN